MKTQSSSTGSSKELTDRNRIVPDYVLRFLREDAMPLIPALIGICIILLPFEIVNHEFDTGVGYGLASISGILLVISVWRYQSNYSLFRKAVATLVLAFITLQFLIIAVKNLSLLIL